MSATTIGKRSSPCAETRASRTAASRPSLRPTSTTRAPRPASRSVAARPRPDVGPVIRTVCPASAASGGASQPKSRLRTAGPIREKLATTVSSRISSMSVLRSHGASGIPSTSRSDARAGRRGDRLSLGRSSDGSCPRPSAPGAAGTRGPGRRRWRRPPRRASPITEPALSADGPEPDTAVSVAGGVAPAAGGLGRAVEGATTWRAFPPTGVPAAEPIANTL